jgi:hypothetical protein
LNIVREGDRLRRLLRLSPGVRRTAALAAWLQSLYPPAAPPVLVGGGAVELLTGGGYVTGDLDFVGEVPARVARALAACGFERRGRHWIHSAGELFVEFPSRRLEPASEPVAIEVEDEVVWVIAPEALLADRLKAWKFWRSEVDAANALRLLQSPDRRLNAKLASRFARQLEVEDERQRLLRFARRLGGRPPSEEEMGRWTRS